MNQLVGILQVAHDEFSWWWFEKIHDCLFIDLGKLSPNGRTNQVREI
jgi:hypothetical protein